jgi:hypothetical protein
MSVREEVPASPTVAEVDIAGERVLDALRGTCEARWRDTFVSRLALIALGPSPDPVHRALLREVVLVAGVEAEVLRRVQRGEAEWLAGLAPEFRAVILAYYSDTQERETGPTADEVWARS